MRHERFLNTPNFDRSSFGGFRVWGSSRAYVEVQGNMRRLSLTYDLHIELGVKCRVEGSSLGNTGVQGLGL